MQLTIPSTRNDCHRHNDDPLEIGYIKRSVRTISNKKRKKNEKDFRFAEKSINTAVNYKRVIITTTAAFILNVPVINTLCVPRSINYGKREK